MINDNVWRKIVLHVFKDEIKNNNPFPKMKKGRFNIHHLNLKVSWLYYTYMFKNDPKDEFINFLNKHNALEKYIVNINSYGFRYKSINKICEFGNSNINQFINQFDWSRTIEGHKYWENLHDKWVNKIICL